VAKRAVARKPEPTPPAGLAAIPGTASSKATEFRLTRTGREALERYLSHMEGLIRSTRAGS
jgi:hypothetical protein